MKKILFVCDANNFPLGAFTFLKNLNFSDPVLVTGAFFHSINYDLVIPTTFAVSGSPLVAFNEADVKSVAISIGQFKERCERSGIEYRVHEESAEFKLEDLIKESRFADLIVMSEEVFCSHLQAQQPNYYMQNVIHNAECPVLLIPEKYKPFSRLIVAYDGKKESVFAMKQFCYLFPQFTNHSTTVLYLHSKEIEDVPDVAYLEEYAARHFASLSIEKVMANKKTYFNEWMENRKDCLLITGSFSRSALASVFHESFIEKTIHEHQVPIFIAHHS